MLINVPQYIDVEDKVAGPLTAKQLLWMIGLGVALIVLWNLLSKMLFIVIGIPVALVFVALAFYKPFGQPLPNFMFQGILYMFRPKIYVWRRTFKPEITISKGPARQDKNAIIKDKRVSDQTLHDLANVMDSSGAEHNKDIDEWISAHGQRNKG